MQTCSPELEQPAPQVPAMHLGVPPENPAGGQPLPQPLQLLGSLVRSTHAVGFVVGQAVVCEPLRMLHNPLASPVRALEHAMHWDDKLQAFSQQIELTQKPVAHSLFPEQPVLVAFFEAQLVPEQ
jgi:hypothetical protein